MFLIATENTGQQERWPHGMAHGFSWETFGVGRPASIERAAKARMRRPARGLRQAERPDGINCARWPVSRVLSTARGQLDDHSSGTPVTRRLTRPTRTTARKCAWLTPAVPTWSCSRWGLPCRSCCQSRGALLPHPFTLTCWPIAWRTGGLLSVALSLGSPPPAVSRHRIPVEPGLSSTPRCRGAAAARPSGCALLGPAPPAVKPSTEEVLF